MKRFLWVRSGDIAANLLRPDWTWTQSRWTIFRRRVPGKDSKKISLLFLSLIFVEIFLYTSSNKKKTSSKKLKKKEKQKMVLI